MKIQPNALERMVATFKMSADLPEDLDFDSPEVKMLLDSMEERQRSMFLTMAKWITQQADNSSVEESDTNFNKISGDENIFPGMYAKVII